MIRFEINGLIPAGPSLGVIFGQPKSGKSFLTADMFLHVAMGRDYCGCAVQQGGVVYITKEGVRGFKRRMMAMRHHQSAGPQVPFYVAYEMPNFGTDNGDADELVALIKKLVPRGVHIAAIIIDTLARTMPGQADSDPAVVSQFVENCDTVARAFDCFVGAVHHGLRSTDTRRRGSNVLDAAADVIISVVKERDRGRTAKIEAQGRRRRAGVAVSCYRKAKPRRRAPHHDTKGRNTMNTATIARLPTGSRSNHLGVCPICRRQNGCLNEGRINWIVCHAHRVKWTIGSNVLSGWKHLTAEQRFAEADKLTGYREVEPFNIQKHGTDAERAAYAEMLQIATRLGLRVEIYTEEIRDPLDAVGAIEAEEPPF
jgi:hypothetical protein